MCRTFNDIDAMWKNALVKLSTRGRHHNSRIGETREIIGYSARLNAVDGFTFLLNPRRRLSPIYANAELIWYLSREESIKRIVAYAPQYVHFANDGVAKGAYGHRWGSNLDDDGVDQFEYILDLLASKSNTRQAIVTMWNASPDLYRASDGGINDIPCTLSWQFICRDNALHMINTMRSQDIWLGMPYDVYVNTCIQRLIANTLDMRVGTYTHNCGSLHLYSKHYKAAAEAMDYGPPEAANNCWGTRSKWTRQSHNRVCALERMLREGVFANMGGEHTPFERLQLELREFPVGSLYADALYCVAYKWGLHDVRTAIESPALRKALGQYVDH